VGHDSFLVSRILEEAKHAVLDEIGRVVADRSSVGYAPLYATLADYPFREGKGLRPAILLSACRAAGGRTDQGVVSAAAVELFHNAFLVHDDIEDGSEFRRGLATLPVIHGVPIAINVGDATNVLAIGLLLENVANIGVRKALLVFREIERMARESVEGQAMELGWISDQQFDLTDDDYVRMAYKKTCWYTVIAPLRIGVICGAQPGHAAPLEHELRGLTSVGFWAGLAFQVQDDLLNLEGDEHVYGKERNGDLWEGKRTVMLLHFVRTAPPDQRERALRLLRMERRDKDPGEVAWLSRAMQETGSMEHGRNLARHYCARAIDLHGQLSVFVVPGDDQRFLREMLEYVVDRTK
jgi:geranylgeranyl diphosphate synthase type II